MKISERTHPALSFLNTGLTGNIGFSKGTVTSRDEAIILLGFLQPIFRDNIKKFNKCIQYCHSSFIDAVVKSANNLIELIDNNEYLEFSGTTLFCNKKTVFLTAKLKGKLITNAIYFEFQSISDNVVLASFFLINNEKLEYFYMSDNYYSSDFKYEFIEISINNFISLELFKRYAEIETINLKPHSRKRDINCKYINDTNYNILHLDSKWFTTLVKSDEFKVSGHFRLQPYKNESGKWDKKLIWITDFIKHGYTSKARKLSFIDNE